MSEPVVARRPNAGTRWPALLVGNLPVILLGLLVVVAALGPWISPYNPAAVDFSARLEPPGLLHPFGTDAVGRDIFSAVLSGAWISLSVGASVVALSVAIGLVVGATAGYFGGVVDSVLMRVSDVFLAFPPLLLPIAIQAVLGPGLVNMVLAISLSWFAWYARLARGSVVVVRETLYVESARTMGLPSPVILWRHVIPNSLTPVMVQAALDFGNAILTAAALSFIGAGARPPTPEWGLLVSQARTTFLDFWWTATFPGLAIVLVVILINMCGDWLLRRLDPRQRGDR